MPGAHNPFYTNWPENPVLGYNMYDYFFSERMPALHNRFPASDKPEGNFIAGNFAENIKAQYIRANGGWKTRWFRRTTFGQSSRKTKKSCRRCILPAARQMRIIPGSICRLRPMPKKNSRPSPSEKPRGTIMNGAIGIWKSGALTFFGL